MFELDDQRLRYPIEYVTMVGCVVSDIQDVEEKPDLVRFRIKSPHGFSITVQGRKELLDGLKEGTVKEGQAEGMIKFAVPDDRDLSKAKPFMSVEEWKDVKIE